MEQEILELESLAAQMFETSNIEARQHAEKVLVSLVDDPQSLDKCQMLLARASSPYAQHIAASTLIKVVSKPTAMVNAQQRLGIRNYIVNYISMCSEKKLPSFVTQALLQLYARITKLSWFEGTKDDWLFRNVVQDVTKFLQGGANHCVMGVQLLHFVVLEMNQSENMHPITRHRKVASSFRDNTLFDIFQLACNLLTQATSGQKIEENTIECELVNIVLKLLYSCLAFDFIGTSQDDSSDDLCTVQIPTSWRSSLLDHSTLELFFKLFELLPISLCDTVLSCLVQMASVRRSLLNNQERSKYLSDLLEGIHTILKKPGKLSNASVYHEFCRLLARLKSNYQLGELVKVPCYAECICCVADFTVQSLRMWQFSPNSLHYLLSLWQRMAASVPYVKAQEPHLLESYTPGITKAFIESRLESVEVVLRDSLENPLDDMAVVKQQLEQISTIARCDYDKTCQLLVSLFDKSAGNFEELLRGNVAEDRLLVPQGQLSWIVYLIGAVIGGRVSFASNDDHDTMDGELVVRVLQLMNITDRRLADGHGFANIELALLFFFEQYRKIYIGDQVQKTSKVYKRLSEVLNLTDDSMILSVFVTKTISNLKYWSSHEQIISRTLQLLSDLSVGYSSVRKMIKLEAVQFLLDNHMHTNFPFLGADSPITDLRCRTTFYIALGRLLMVDLGDDEERFDRFIQPLATALEAVVQAMQSVNENNRDMQDVVVKTLIGTARDLQGIAYSFNSKSSYHMLFEWLYPNYLELFQRAIEIWFHNPGLTTPILKMMGELVLNRGQRLNFDVSSPYGILLFKQASKIMCTYGSQILSVNDIPKDKMYSHKLKGISLCFNLLKQSLCGNYVNFGVFHLYKDQTLDDVFNTFIKLVMSIPKSDLLEYPKLSLTYYTLLEVLSQDHMNFITGLQSPVIHHLMSTISDGLNALDATVCTCCCTILDHFVSYLFRLVTRNNHARQLSHRKRNAHDPHAEQRDAHFVQVMTQMPEMMQQILFTVLNIIMFEDCKNQWSMSRPLLGLILINYDYFTTLRKSMGLGNEQGDGTNAKYSAIQSSFDVLMDGVDRNLHTKNRDRFTQNLSVFRREINETLRSSTPSTTGLDLSSNSRMSNF